MLRTKQPRSPTLAMRLARLCAIALVVIAFAILRPPTLPQRFVLLLSTEEAWDPVAPLSAAGSPALSLVATGEILEAGARGGDEFWRDLLRRDASREGPESFVWEDAEGPVVVVGLPQRIRRGSDGRGWAPLVADHGSGFVGGNAMVRVDSRRFAGGALPPPYDSSVSSAREAAQDLEVGRWSRWISVEASDAGEFQFVRTSDTELRFSPVYRVGERSSGETREPGFPSEPFLADADETERNLFGEHLLELRAKRAGHAVRLLSRELSHAIVYDGVGDEIRTLWEKAEIPKGFARRSQESLTETVRDLAASGAERTMVLVVWGVTMRRAKDGGPTRPRYALLEGGAPTNAAAGPPTMDLRFTTVRDVVRYFMVAPLPREARGALPAAISGRYPMRTREEAKASPSLPPRRWQPWNPQSLRRPRRRPSRRSVTRAVRR